MTDRMQNTIDHIKTSVDVDEWAVDEVIRVFEAFDKIKALEQESVLDKIRAEIVDLEEELFHRPNTDYADYAAVRYCVEIIDKYKEERSDKE